MKYTNMTLKSLVLCGAAVFSISAGAANYSLDLREKSAAVAANSSTHLQALQSVQTEDGVLRRVNLEAGRTAVEGLEVGDELELALFDDVVLHMTLVEKTPSPLGGKSFLASVAGYEGICNAVVYQTDDGLQVDVQSFKSGKVYTIYSTAEGVLIKEIEKSKKAQNCEELKVEVPSAIAAKNVPRLMNEVAEEDGAATNTTCVDILVVYDKLGAEWAKLNGGVTNFAVVSVQKINSALASTGLDKKFRVRLVGVKTISGSGKKDEGASFNSLLTAIVKDTMWNGYAWGNIQLMREAVGADIVCILTDTGSEYGTTGSGFSLDSENASYFADNAYSCCAVRAVEQGHTMTHEVGHNMGAGHSDKMAQKSNCGPQYYKYSSGYYFYADDVGYYTIMAYNADGYGNTYYSVPYFSSPNYTYEDVAVGDATHDNTRTLENNFAAVAAFRAEKYVDGEEWIEVEEPLSFAAATVFNGEVKASGTSLAGTIQVKVGKASSRTGISKLTAYVTLAGQKKKTIRGEFKDGVATFADTSLALQFSAQNIEGTYGEYTISGAKDIFSSRDTSDKETSAAVLKKLSSRGNFAMAWKKYFAQEGWNYLTLTIGSKGKTKVAGMMADGTKVSATTTLIVDGSVCSVPIILTKQGMTFLVTMDVLNAETLKVDGAVVDPVVGYARAWTGNAAFYLERTPFSTVLGDSTYADYFPNGVKISAAGTKWVLPKAGKITMKKGVLDESKAGENPGGLKLTYKAKGNTFTGSFKAYTANGNKIKSNSVKVAGVVISGKGYGTAYIRKKGSAAVTIE